VTKANDPDKILQIRSPFQFFGVRDNKAALQTEPSEQQVILRESASLVAKKVVNAREVLQQRHILDFAALE
jgi:hypothetical protein